jgi:hypothetical protein
MLLRSTKSDEFPTRIDVMRRNWANAAPATCSVTLMPEGGADIQLLGHAELSTTQIYIQVSIQQLKHAAPGP